MMKNISVFVYLLALLVSVSLQAQDDKPKKNWLRAGYHLATMVDDGSKPENGKDLSSFYVGFVREQKIAPILHFGKGIEYFQNGIRYTDDSKRVLHTISIPLNLKLKLGPVFALGGAAANIKVAEKIFQGNDINNPIESDKSNWFDFAPFAGAGVKILFIAVEARYHWGLVEARDNGLHNRYFQLGAAISF